MVTGTLCACPDLELMQTAVLRVHTHIHICLDTHIYISINIYMSVYVYVNRYRTVSH